MATDIIFFYVSAPDLAGVIGIVTAIIVLLTTILTFSMKLGEWRKERNAKKSTDEDKE